MSYGKLYKVRYVKVYERNIDANGPGDAKRVMDEYMANDIVDSEDYNTVTAKRISAYNGKADEETEVHLWSEDYPRR